MRHRDLARCDHNAAPRGRLTCLVMRQSAGELGSYVQAGQGQVQVPPISKRSTAVYLAALGGHCNAPTTRCRYCCALEPTRQTNRRYFSPQKAMVR